MPLEWTSSVCLEAEIPQHVGQTGTIGIHVCCLFTSLNLTLMSRFHTEIQLCFLFAGRNATRLSLGQTGPVGIHVCGLFSGSTFAPMEPRLCSCNTHVFFVYRNTTRSSGVKAATLECLCIVCLQQQLQGCNIGIHVLFTATTSRLQHWNTCVLFAYSNNFKAATLEYMCVVVYRNPFRTFGVKVATQGCNTRVLFVRLQNDADLLFGQELTLDIHVCMPKSCNEPIIQQLFAPALGTLIF